MQYQISICLAIAPNGGRLAEGNAFRVVLGMADSTSACDNTVYAQHLDRATRLVFPFPTHIPRASIPIPNDITCSLCGRPIDVKTVGGGRAEVGTAMANSSQGPTLINGQKPALLALYLLVVGEVCDSFIEGIDDREQGIRQIRTGYGRHGAAYGRRER